MDPEPERYEIVVPPELEAGVYASSLHPWHDMHELTLDFAAPAGEGEILLTAVCPAPQEADRDL